MIQCSSLVTNQRVLFSVAFQDGARHRCALPRLAGTGVGTPGAGPERQRAYGARRTRQGGAEAWGFTVLARRTEMAAPAPVRSEEESRLKNK